MISIQNYRQKRKGFDLSKLDAETKEVFDSVDADFDDFLELYNDSSPEFNEIREIMNNHIELSNKLFGEEGKKSTAATGKIKDIARKSDNIIIAKPKPVKFKDTTEKPKNLTQFKKWLKDNVGKTLYLYSMYRSETTKDTRKIKNVQSNSVEFERGVNGKSSWLDYGKASEWSFDKDYAEWQEGNTVLRYYYEKPKSYNTHGGIDLKASKKAPKTDKNTYGTAKDIIFTNAGGYTIASTKAKMKNGDYTSIAAIDEDNKKIESWYIPKNNLNDSVIEKIEKFANGGKRPTTAQQIAATKFFKKFVPKHQQKALVQENSEELDSVIDAIEKQLSEIPKKENGKKAKEATVHAHYFYGGSDWFVLDNPYDGEFFGFVILNGDSQMAELGYMSIDELVNQGKVELDFYWKKKPLAQALHDADPDYFEKPGSTNNKKSGTGDKKKPAPTPKKPTKKVEKAVDITEVAHYTKDYLLIRRFYNLVSKKEVAPFRTIQLIFMAFNKAAVERTVRKKSPNASLFNKVNEKVVKLYDSVKDQKENADIDFTDKKLLAQMEDFVKEVKVNYAVTLLKSFIGMQGYKPDVKKASNLLKRIDNAIEKGRVTKSNRLYDQLIAAKKALETYIKKPSTKIEPDVYGLSAPRGVCTNRIKCAGLRNDGKLRKGYRFLIDGIVAKSKKKAPKKKVAIKRKSKRGLGKPVLVLGAGKPYARALALDVAASNRDAAATALGMPIIEPAPVQPIASAPKKTQVTADTKKKSGLAKKMSEIGSGKHEFYRSSGDLSRFIGGVEIKPIESVVTTLDAPQGAMKTRLFFQAINHYATLGYKVLFLSLEEHPDSALFKKKRDQYINPMVWDNIETIGELPNGFSDFANEVPNYDIIFIDSWGKLTKNDKNIDLDNDVRKAFNSKWFWVIYQRTVTGTMRGGSNSQFDGDQIMKIMKDDVDYKNNYAYWDKNRYELEPGLKYNIYHQRMHDDGVNGVTRTQVNTEGILML